MSFSRPGTKKLLMGFVLSISVSCFFTTSLASPMPCNASSAQTCRAALYYVPETARSLKETASLFRVNANVVKRTVDAFLVVINCSCLDQHDYFAWHVDYAVQQGDTWDSISLRFGSFLVKTPEKGLVPSRIVTLDLSCGCAQNVEIVTYNVRKGDTVFTICSRFRANLTMTAMLNKLDNPGLIIYAGDTIFIPEKAASLQNFSIFDVGGKDIKTKRSAKSEIRIIIGAISAAFTVMVLATILILWRNHKRKQARQSTMEYTEWSEASVVSSLYSDKATVFPYREICEATFNFSSSQKIGQGSYGSVYLRNLRGTIELIGYAAGRDSLFLVYEYAQNGALSDHHLRQPSSRGHEPLSWTARIQIALDAAKGLEYIHEHTKPYYVHREVKTINILLDSNFRAKIADFGLAKLLGHSPEIGALASRIVGTLDYLAPEYVRDGCVTTKSDVYAFGVVLMELITGQPALSKEYTSSERDHHNEHRSLVHYMLSALKDPLDPVSQLTAIVDPNLSCYHKDSVFQIALLAKDGVSDDWNRRPDMSRVVLRLSHILCSKEWEGSGMQ